MNKLLNDEQLRSTQAIRKLRRRIAFQRFAGGVGSLAAEPGRLLNAWDEIVAPAYTQKHSVNELRKLVRSCETEKELEAEFYKCLKWMTGVQSSSDLTELLMEFCRNSHQSTQFKRRLEGFAARVSSEQRVAIWLAGELGNTYLGSLFREHLSWSAENFEALLDHLGLNDEGLAEGFQFYKELSSEDKRAMNLDEFADQLWMGGNTVEGAYMIAAY